MNTTASTLASTATSASRRRDLGLRQPPGRRRLKRVLMSAGLMLAGVLGQGLLGPIGLSTPEPQAQAVTMDYTVTLDTSDLQGFDSQQPFSLDFLLSNSNGVVGSGTSGATSSAATLSNFNFGTAPAGEAAPGVFGTRNSDPNTSGSLGTGATPTGSLTLNENPNDIQSEFVQTFNPGNLLRFSLSANNQNTTLDPPDSFSFFILGSNGVPIQTFDALGRASSANQLFTISFNGDGSQTIEQFGFRDAQGNLNIAQVTPVPEPTTMALMLAGLGAMAAAKRKRRKRNADMQIA